VVSTDPRPHDLRALATTEDASRAVAPEGEAVLRAIEMGIDLTLLRRSLERTPAERIRLAAEHAQLMAEIQTRTVPAPIREMVRRRRLQDKLTELRQLTGESPT
jgi:hypothetical protein